MNASAVSSILKEGLIISTKIGASNAWHRNVIYKYEDMTVHIGLLEAYIQYMMLEGTKIILKYSNDYFEYLFDGVVSSIKPACPGLIAIRINKAEEIINTRGFHRYDTSITGTIRSVWDDTERFCIIVNVSLGGMAFFSAYSFDQGEECSIDINLPASRHARAKGKIIKKSSKNGQFSYNMQFIEMLEEDNNYLSDYLSELDRLDAAIHENYLNHTKESIL